MKKSFKIFGVIACMFVMMFAVVGCGAGSKSVEQKGWDKYCQYGADEFNKPFDEYQQMLQNNLTVEYVYLEETNTVYYKAYYGEVPKTSTTFYILYDVDDDTASESTSSTAYDYAEELYSYYGYAGRIGKLDF